MLKKLEKKRRVLELGCALGFALTVLLTAFAAHRRQVADRVCADTVRLHILANSDTLEDQLVKLQVRDAILAALPDSVLQADTTTGAEAALRQALPVLHQAAQQALYKAHIPQTARLKLERLDFAPRDYGSFALPGGEYTALRIELGGAQGRNWFCVLYPALCLSGAQSDYPTKAENALVFGRYEVRFALAELVGRMASPEGLRPQARVGAQPPKAALSA